MGVHACARADVDGSGCLLLQSLPFGVLMSMSLRPQTCWWLNAMCEDEGDMSDVAAELLHHIERGAHRSHSRSRCAEISRHHTTPASLPPSIRLKHSRHLPRHRRNLLPLRLRLRVIFLGSRGSVKCAGSARTRVVIPSIHWLVFPSTTGISSLQFNAINLPPFPKSLRDFFAGRPKFPLPLEDGPSSPPPTVSAPTSQRKHRRTRSSGGYV